MFSRELKKGSTEMLVLSLLEARARHGYEIGKQIESASGGQLRFRIGSLYPILCRLEDKGLISGRWIERPGERRRRFYKLTPAGRKALERYLDHMESLIRATREK
jgi:DNA-binding PadR family transcriptional regulator